MLPACVLQTRTLSVTLKTGTAVAVAAVVSPTCTALSVDIYVYGEIGRSAHRCRQLCPYPDWTIWEQDHKNGL